MNIFPVRAKRLLPAVLIINRLGHDMLDLVVIGRDGLFGVVPVLHAFQVVALLRETVVAVARPELLGEVLIGGEVCGHAAVMDKEHRRDVLLDIVLVLEAAVHAGEEVVQARRKPAADSAPEQERLDGLADAKECAAIYLVLLVDRIEQHQ